MSEKQRDEDEVEGLAEAAGAGGPGTGAPGEEGRDAPAVLGHVPADSSTSDAPEGEVVDDPAEVDYVELVKIHNVRDIADARLVKGILESADVPCVVEDDVQDTLDGINPHRLDGIDIMVPVNYERKAKLILCERNIVCGIEPARIEELSGDLADRALAGEGAARGELAAKLAEETRDYRHEALRRIVKRGRPGVDLVLTLLRDGARAAGDEESPIVGDVAALADQGAFGKAGAGEVVAELGKLAADADPGVRKRAARALGRLRGSGAGAILVGLLSDEDAGVRDEALESLYSLSKGETFDFDPDLSPAGQQEALRQWKEWVEENPAA